MRDFKKKCQQYFQSTDFYEILDVKKGATEKELKKAYHRLSLLVHPDRVDKSNQEEATEKFKVLGKIHSILQDKSKRQIYDDTGNYDDEDDTAAENWMDYWRSLFKPITKEDIRKYEEEYIGSDRELRDIKKAYEAGKGSMDIMLELVPFSNCDSEDRIISIVRGLVDSGELPEYKRFFKEPAAKKEKRRRKYEKERVESEKISHNDLVERIQGKRHNFLDMLQNLEDKYSTKKQPKRKAIASASTRPKRAKK